MTEQRGAASSVSADADLARHLIDHFLAAEWRGNCSLVPTGPPHRALSLSLPPTIPHSVPLSSSSLLFRYCHGNIVIPLERGRIMRSWSSSLWTGTRLSVRSIAERRSDTHRSTRACFRSLRLDKYPNQCLFNRFDRLPSIDKDTMITRGITA